MRWLGACLIVLAVGAVVAAIPGQFLLGALAMATVMYVYNDRYR